jgi:hypothetical protein
MRINALLVVWIVVLGIAQLAISAEMELPKMVTQGEEINLTLKLDGAQACLVFTPLEGGEPFTYSCFFKDGTFSIDSNRLSLGTYRVELKDSANDQILASSVLMVTSEPVQQLTDIYTRPNPFDLTLPDARVEFVNVPGAGVWITVSILRRARQLFWISVGFVAFLLIIRKTDGVDDGKTVYNS